MITVAEAEKIILSKTKDFGSEVIPFEQVQGRVLAEDLLADRDLPPCNRSTMDGIAIRYTAFEQGCRTFPIRATIAAGNAPIDIAANECVEIMTGAMIPETADTVIRYEDVSIQDNIADVHTDNVRKAQNIHHKGKDKKEGEIVATVGYIADAALISMAASVGKEQLRVKKLPRVAIISTGDELVDINANPAPYELRRSNGYTIKAVLQQWHIVPAIFHIPDDPAITRTQLKQCLDEYDALILSGSVSMGKFDHLPQVLEELAVKKLFHKVSQRPGKPFWFGEHENGALVFAFPGNPVSAFMCLHRYFIPWLAHSIQAKQKNPKYAILDREITFTPPLQYFVQVQLSMNEQGQLIATPDEGNGSGDYSNLVDTDAFMELPLEQSNFKKGTAYRVWPFKQV